MHRNDREQVYYLVSREITKLERHHNSPLWRFLFNHEKRARNILTTLQYDRITHKILTDDDHLEFLGRLSKMPDFFDVHIMSKKEAEAADD